MNIKTTTVTGTDKRATPRRASGRRAAYRSLGSPQPRLSEHPGRPDIWTFIHGFSLVVAALIIFRLDRRVWFYQDEWDLLSHRMLPALSPLIIFTPHNEHWTTLATLVYRGIFDIVGIRSYTPYLAVDVVSHLVASHLLWRLMKRTGSRAAVATAAVGVFAVLGAGSADLTTAFQMTFVTALMFGLAALLLADREESDFCRGDVGVCVVEIVALTCSGAGVTMVVVVALAVLLRRGWKPAIPIAVVPGAVYVAWYFIYGRVGYTSDHVTTGTLLGFPDYVWKGLSTTLGAASGINGAGPLLLLALIGYGIVRIPRAQTVAAPAFAAALGALVFFFIAGAGRLNLTPDESTAGRYTYIAAALLLPLAGLLLTELSKTSRAQVAAILAAGSLVWVSNVAMFRATAHDVATAGQATKAQILAAGQILRSATRTFGLTPEPVGAAPLSTQALRAFVRRGDLPSTTTTPSRGARLGAELALLVGSTSSPAWGSEGVTVPGLAPGSGSCISLVGPVSTSLLVDVPSSLQISVPTALALQDSLRALGSPVASTLPGALSIPKGTSYLNANLTNRSLLLNLTDGQSAQICNVLRPG